MARDLNQCNFIGRLGKDPEIRYSSDGKAIANISLACGDSYKDKNGNNVDKTEWVRVIAFGKLAEIVGQYLTKGSQVFLNGKLQTRKWQDQGGQDRYSTEIIANELQMLGGKSDNSNHKKAPVNNQNPAPPSPPAFEDFDDDIPF